MTAVALVRTADSVIVANDGVAYDDMGILDTIGPKLVLLPHLSCVVAESGTGNSAARVVFKLDRSASTFDEFLLGVEGAAREVAEYYATDEYQARTFIEGPHHFSLYIAGWSDERSRAETYLLRSRVISDEKEEFDPFTLNPLPEIYTFPWLSDELARRFGMPDLTGEGPISINASDYALRAVCAARHFKVYKNIKDEPHYGVGGFLQLTAVSRDRIDSQIVHRWPDVIGELIDPTRGEPMPAFLSSGGGKS